MRKIDRKRRSRKSESEKTDLGHLSELAELLTEGYSGMTNMEHEVEESLDKIKNSPLTMRLVSDISNMQTTMLKKLELYDSIRENRND